MNTRIKNVVLVCCIVALQLNTVKAEKYEAVVLEPFEYQSIYDSEKPAGYYYLYFPAEEGEYVSPGWYVYNSVLGTYRKADIEVGDVPYTTGWAGDGVKISLNPRDTELVDLEFGHYTTLSSHHKLGWGPDPGNTYVDIITSEGRITFEPFDESLGTLNAVTVRYHVTMDTAVVLSLLDESFLSNSEGRAKAKTVFQVWLGTDRGGDEPPYIPEAPFIALSSNLDTGWKTSWKALTKFIADFNTGAMGGGPDAFMVATCLLEAAQGNNDLCYPEPVDWSKSYRDEDEQVLAEELTMTPEDYRGFLGQDGSLPIEIVKYDSLEFTFEGNDTYDSAKHVSDIEQRIRIIYDYTPVPEPSISLLVGMLLFLSCCVTRLTPVVCLGLKNR